MAFLMQQLFDDLQDLLMTVHVWQQDKSALRQLANIDIEKYSFHWHALGVYPCIQYCDQDCFGTRHWMLDLSLGHHRMILRVLQPDKRLICKLPQAIHFNHAIIWKRIVLRKN